MRIVLDAMAGDFGPEPLVQGAIRAVEETDNHVILSGDAEVIETILNREQALHPRLSIMHADTVIGMDEAPRASLRKRNSSLAVAADLVKGNEAEGLVSAGNTGATLAHTIQKWRSLPGVSRPALATILPVPQHPVVLLDVGGTSECKPLHLRDFAVMGAMYAREIFGRRNPRVGLLNIGAEEGKGNDLVIAAYKQLSDSPAVNFIGNVEGTDVVTGRCDVIVCDGFVGNVVLKFAEGFSSMFFRQMKSQMVKGRLMTRLAGLGLKPVFTKMRTTLDSAEYGGAPLLGVNGICIVAHGSSKASAIKSAIRMAGDCVKHGLNEKIVDTLGGKKSRHTA